MKISNAYKACLLWLGMLACASSWASNDIVVSEKENVLIMLATESYVLGDGDTIMDGRNMALQNAKRLASEKAGSYIHAEKLIVNDAIEANSIVTLSTAFVSANILKESVSVTPDNRVQITLLLEMTLDRNSLMGRLGSLTDSKQKQELMATVTRENASLRQELDALNLKIQSLNVVQESNEKNIQIARPIVYGERDRVLNSLEGNQNIIRRIFGKSDLSIIAAAGASELAEAKADIDRNIFEYIRNNIAIKVSDPMFSDNGDGTTDMEVRLAWRVADEPIIKTFSNYFYSDDVRVLKLIDPALGRVITIPEHTKINGVEEKRPYTKKLFEYIASKSLSIQLMAGAHTHTILVTGNSDNLSVNEYLLQTQSPKYGYLIKKQKNWVLKKIPIAELNAIHSVDAKVVLK